MVYLDGKKVADDVVDPALHKFIGSFRYPSFNIFYDNLTIMSNGKCFDVVACGCNHHLWTREAVFEHFNMGHFDINQYESIERER